MTAEGEPACEGGATAPAVPTLVPLSHGESLFAWANEPKELRVFERGDHNTILHANEEAYFAEVGRFLRSI